MTDVFQCEGLQYHLKEFFSIDDQARVRMTSSLFYHFKPNWLERFLGRRMQPQLMLISTFLMSPERVRLRWINRSFLKASCQLEVEYFSQERNYCDDHPGYALVFRYCTGYRYSGYQSGRDEGTLAYMQDVFYKAMSNMELAGLISESKRVLDFNGHVDPDLFQEFLV